ncbi:hypothetical protein BH11PLA2_BH11PLA2_52770 [soil metagenome]
MDCTGPCDVVEFGCGYGHFTVAAAQAVQGTVIALDIDPGMIAATLQRAGKAGVDRVVALQRDFLAEGSGLANDSVHYAMLFNILHVEEPATLLTEAFRVLAPGGRVGIIHWKNDPNTPRGPSLEIRPTSEQCRTWAGLTGFRFVRNEDLCCCSWHWGLVMEKPQVQ